jgi:hypothetical protein
MLVKHVPPLEMGIRRGKNWRRRLTEVGISAIDLRGLAEEFLNHGRMRTCGSASQILARSFLRVSIKA